MFNWLEKRRARKRATEELNDIMTKQRLCKPCVLPCGQELCEKIGCLNQDMRSNFTRLHYLVVRLEEYGYEFSTRRKRIFEDENQNACRAVVQQTPDSNVIRVSFPNKRRK